MSSSGAITTFAAAAAATLEQVNAPVALSFARDLAGLAGKEASGAASRVPACRHLEQPPLVDAAVPGAAALEAALSKAQAVLSWRQSCRPDAPDLYNDNHAFVELAGPDGHITADAIRFGLFILGPQVYYPPHVHEAEEFYIILSGTADWQQDDDPYRPVPPGEIVHNVSMQPHAMRVKSEPVIMFWGWCGDIGWERYGFV